MKGFGDIHPHSKAPPGALSQGELKHWMRELYTNPAYGWAGHGAALARALGFGDKSAISSMKSKFREVNPAWIYPGEQLRLSRLMRKILAGQIVCRMVGKRWEAVVADCPQPLKLPPRFRYNLARGGLEWSMPNAPAGATLPSFAKIMCCAQPMKVRGS